MPAIHPLTRLLPITTDTTGKRPPPIYTLLRKLVRLPSTAHLPDGILADTTQPSERILAYFFYNVLRHYRKSPLYRYMRTRLQPGDIFLDIGAHLGIYSYLARKRGATTILCEADPVHAAFLDRNKHLFDQVFCLAAADRSEMATFFRGRQDNTGAGSLVASSNPWETSGYDGVTQVQSARMDTLLNPAIWPRVALVKIDVEGAEAQVLRGMGEWLGKGAFDIWCEVRDHTSDRNPGSYEDVCRIAAGAGYRPHVFDGNDLMPFKTDHLRRVFDLLLLKEDGAGPVPLAGLTDGQSAGTQNEDDQ